MSNQPSVISCRDLTKTFVIGKQEVPVLKGIDLAVIKGERLAKSSLQVSRSPLYADFYHNHNVARLAHSCNYPPISEWG